jgi:hypothetical protein
MLPQGQERGGGGILFRVGVALSHWHSSASGTIFWLLPFLNFGSLSANKTADSKQAIRVGLEPSDSAGAPVFCDAANES